MTPSNSIFDKGYEPFIPFIISETVLKFHANIMFEWQKLVKIVLIYAHYQKIHEFINLRV